VNNKIVKIGQLVATAVLASGPGICVQATAVSYETIVLTGDAVPGAGAGVVFDQLSTPVLNNAGQVAFTGLLSGAGVDETSNNGAWVGDSNSISTLAREGDAVPEAGSGVTLGSFSRLRLSDSGQTAMLVNLVGSSVSSVNEDSLWVQDQSGILGMVARDGDIAPGTIPGVAFLHISPFFSLSDSGQIVFVSTLVGPIVNGANDNGTWVQENGQLDLVVRRGDSVPRTSLGETVRGMWSPTINGSGQIVFTGFLAGNTVDDTNDRGVWSQAGGALSLIARAGNAAPGAGSGAVFTQDIRPAVINDAGQIAFQATYLRDNREHSGIWFMQENGTLDALLLAGDFAPGMGLSNAEFSALGEPSLNGSGGIAFVGRVIHSGPVDSQSDSGIWSQGNGDLALVAREGDTPPGAAAGIEFADFDSGVGPERKPVINNAGQVAFSAELRGPGISGENRRGVYATNLEGQLILIARQGDLFDVNDDPLVEDLRTIQNVFVTFFSGTFSGSGGEDGRQSSFNDAGQLAFSLDFLDGTWGVFIANIEDILIGDITDDGLVGADDLDILLANWGDAVGSGAGAMNSGDLSGDGVVGQADLNILLGAWGDGTPPEVNIPEPSALSLLSIGVLSMLRRRR